MFLDTTQVLIKMYCAIWSSNKKDGHLTPARSLVGTTTKKLGTIIMMPTLTDEET